MQWCSLKDWVYLLLQKDYVGVNRNKIIRLPVIDSRLVQKGDIFFAIPGSKTKGEFFLKEVAERGGVAAVISSSYVGSSYGLELIFVDDVVKSLQEAAKRFIEKFNGKIIGITGSVGKTTVKSFLQQLLQPFCKVFASPLSYNSQITFPLSILLADGNEDYLLLEMGSSEPGNIEALMSIATPDIAIITAINEQHALFYKDGIMGICQEKSKILLESKTKQQILPRDSNFFSYLFSVNTAANRISFSISDSEADFYYKVLEKDRIVIKTPLGDHEKKVSFPYFPCYINYLISVATFISLGFSPRHLENKKNILKLPSMRFEVIDKGHVILVNDAFNATPDGMLYAFQGVKKMQGRKVFILSQMNELGIYKEQGHRKVLISALDIASIVFLIGDFWSPFKLECACMRSSIYFYEKTDDVIKDLKKVIQNGDIILLKGSRVFELERIIPYI